MRAIPRALGIAAAAGTMLLAAAIPASATPAQANYSGSSTASSAAQAKQLALNNALAQAGAAGFSSSQCLQLGIAQAWPDTALAARAAKNADSATTGPATTWEGSAQVQCATQPAPGTVNLNRYNGPEHLSTTGSAPAGYYLEGSLGWLYSSQVAGTAPLYTCRVWNSVDTFSSPDPNCEGQQFVGALGYIYTAPPAGVASRVLRRCTVAGEHFDSNDYNCEGQTPEGILGYTLD
jgi:hypothetical protein